MAKKRTTKTQKLRQTVQRQIRRMENRGYRFDDALKEKVSTANYQGLSKLQGRRYAKLYEQATAEIDGEIVSGAAYRTFERQESARKAQDTRNKVKTEIEDLDAKQARDFEEARQAQFEEARRAQDERDRQTAEEIEEGQIIYNRILSMISGFPSNGALGLEKMLTREIRKYGADAVLRGLANAPESAISAAETIVYTISGTDTAGVIHQAYVQLYDIITGTKPSAEEAKQMGDVMDSMTDMDEY